MNGAGGYRPYPAYKDSGVEWLGEVPGHWGVIKLGKLGSFLKGGGIARSDIKDNGVPAITYGDIYTQYNIETSSLRKFTSLDVARNAQAIVKGDLLFTASGETLEEIGKTVLYSGSEVGYAGGDIIILRLQEDDPLFTSYVLNSDIGLKQKSSFGRGDIIVHISSSKLKQVVIPLPPLPEQRAIAAFLDRKTAEIDALIAAKERLIALLREKRAALITQAVTKGLDPDVPLKNSGVEWLGEVPEHWEVKRLKFLLVEPLKYGANEVAEFVNTEDPRYIRITDITEDGGLREDTFRSLPPEVAEPFLLKDGDVLFTRSGATVGKVFRYDVRWGVAAYAGYLIRARLDQSDFESKYLELFTQTTVYWDWLRSSFIQSTIQNVSAERYANLTIPFPPLSEQHAITAYLDRKTAEIDELVTRVGDAIERLKEYRTALISAAVTGKIDVRDL